MPAGLSYLTSTLGTAGCWPETASVQAVMGSPRHGNVVVLFYVQGYQPLWAPLIFEGDLLSASSPYGETLLTAIP